MEAVSDHLQDLKASEIPWIAFLDRTAEQSSPRGLDEGFCEIFRRLLLSADVSATAEAALQVDEFYRDTYLPSDPLMRFEDDKGMAEFLATLWESVFDWYV
ncbi:hypothetical protein NKR23_g2103 [Pleurostoma richardsiae]|uniref:Uncharacterized protein n=1 Tax=Pleurostoma richardsiae TaxID=41990 RepID=A0AA38VVF2_9PEZI|nr:hypothetical protein NKR23_g2103 [Pleurostoma richardsiae]